MNRVGHHGEVPWRGLVPASRDGFLGASSEQGAPPVCAWAEGCRWKEGVLSHVGAGLCGLECLPICGYKGQTVGA